MAGELEPVADVAPVMPASEIEPQTDETVNLNELVEGGPPEAELAPPVELPEDEFEEFEWNGKPIKAPKGLKDGVLMHADYTRKTQEVAATRKELDERAQRIEQQSKASEEELGLRAQLINYQRDLEAYANVDWDQFEREDPVDAASHWRRYGTLKEQASQAYHALQQRTNVRTQEAQQETAKRLEETRKFAETNIKGWTPEVDRKVQEFATGTLGFDVDTLVSAYNPKVYHALYLAHVGHQLLSKQTAAPRPSVPATPLTVVAAKASPPARKSIADMDMDEYVAYRNNQEAASGRR